VSQSNNSQGFDIEAIANADDLPFEQQVDRVIKYIRSSVEHRARWKETFMIQFYSEWSEDSIRTALQRVQEAQKPGSPWSIEMGYRTLNGWNAQVTYRPVDAKAAA
jgi:hypothetical protein